MKRLLSLMLVMLLVLSTVLPSAPIRADTQETAAPPAPPWSKAETIASSSHRHEALAVQGNMVAQSDKGRSSADHPIPSFDCAFSPPSARWRTLAAGSAPAAFSQVDYTLVESVLNVSGTEPLSQHIQTSGQVLSGNGVSAISPGSLTANPLFPSGHAQSLQASAVIETGGYIAKATLDQLASNQGRTVENGMVVVDTSSRTAFKVVSPTVFSDALATDNGLTNQFGPLQDTYMVTKPQLHEIFQSLSLGGQEGETVALTRGNITGFAPNIEKNMVMSDAGMARNLSHIDDFKGFKNLYGDLLVDLRFDNEVLEAQLSDNSTVRIKVSGGLGIQNLLVNARYTRGSGYRFAVTLNQESYLVVELEAAIKEEIRIPILGVDVGLGDIGSVTGGVFVIVGLDGTLRLEIAAREYTSTTVGVHGGTFLYVPTSVRPLYDQTIKGDGDVRLTGNVDGYIKFGPMLGIELFGFELLGAGAFLGTGVEVEADAYKLDIELYGILNLYVAFVGERFNLIDYKPTIWQREQMDTAGHLVKFMEAYVYPGRVSSTLEREVTPHSAQDPDGDGFMPVVNASYRVWVVPAAVAFDPNQSASLNHADIRKFPDQGYAKTTGEGVFFQKNIPMLNGSDQVYLEFQHGGNTYFSNPAKPTLPYEHFTITSADYFADRVTGRIQPLRLVNWDADPTDAEARYEWVPYANQPVTIRQMLYAEGSSSILDNGGIAKTRTDGSGNFDTAIPFIDDNGMIEPHWNFDVRADTKDKKPYQTRYFKIRVVLNHNDAVIAGEVPFKATMDMAFSRIIKEVPGSYKRYEEDGRIIDQMVYDESIYMFSPKGSQTVTDDEFHYVSVPFSTQDLPLEKSDLWIGFENIRNEMWRNGSPTKASPKRVLEPAVNAQGIRTGTTVFSQRVTVEWVWQAHPNPVTITSADAFQASAVGDTFQVTATGYAPFLFTLNGAPQGVAIHPSEGTLTIPGGLPAGTYPFTIRAEEDRGGGISPESGLSLEAYALRGKYDGHDPSPPDEQGFTLTIVEPTLGLPPEPSPSAEPVPAPTAKPTPVPSPLPSPSPTPVPTPSPTPIPSPSPTPVPTPSPIPTPSPTPTPTPTPAPTMTPFPSVLPSQTPLPIRFAPVIRDESHGYAFVKYTNTDPLVIPIYATGSTPITWSVEQSGRYPLPDVITMDRDTGVLTIGGNLTTGTYYFVLRAANDVGSDTQACSVKVNRLLVPINPFGDASGGAAPQAGSPAMVQTSVSVATPNQGFFSTLPEVDRRSFFDEHTFSSTLPEVTGKTPPNELTLRIDDPKDVYTNDRWTKNGALYVRWHSCPGVLQQFTHEIEHLSWEDGTGTILMDESPRCDNYHYRKPTEKDDFTDELKRYFQERHLIEQNLSINPLDRWGRDEILGHFDTVSRQKVESVTYFDAAAVVSQIGAKKTGTVEVPMTALTGTLVPGQLFNALSLQPKATVAFSQPGARIAFSGEDVAMGSPHLIQDLGCTQGAHHREAMTAFLSAGSPSFLYRFLDHGALPGMATFTIQTDFSQGESVQVYRYEADTNEMILIAGGVKVGADGMVRYRNNTLSEYLITTQTLTGALRSEVADMQALPSERRPWWPYLGFVAVPAAGLATWLVVHKKKAGARTPAA